MLLDHCRTCRHFRFPEFPTFFLKCPPVPKPLSLNPFALLPPPISLRFSPSSSCLNWQVYLSAMFPAALVGYWLLLSIWAISWPPPAEAISYRCEGDQVLIVQSFGNDTIRMHCQRLLLCGNKAVHCQYEEGQSACGGKQNFVAHVQQPTPLAPVAHTCCELLQALPGTASKEPAPGIPGHEGNDCFVYELPDGSAPDGKKPASQPKKPKLAENDDEEFTLLNSVDQIPSQFGDSPGQIGYRMRLFLLRNKSPPVLLVKAIQRVKDGYRVTICRPRCGPLHQQQKVMVTRPKEDERGGGEKSSEEWAAAAWSSWSSTKWSSWSSLTGANGTAKGGIKGGGRARAGSLEAEASAEAGAEGRAIGGGGGSPPAVINNNNNLTVVAIGGRGGEGGSGGSAVGNANLTGGVGLGVGTLTANNGTRGGRKGGTGGGSDEEEKESGEGVGRGGGNGKKKGRKHGRGGKGKGDDNSDDEEEDGDESGTGSGASGKQGKHGKKKGTGGGGAGKGKGKDGKRRGKGDSDDEEDGSGGDEEEDGGSDGDEREAKRKKEKAKGRGKQKGKHEGGGRSDGDRSTGNGSDEEEEEGKEGNGKEENSGDVDSASTSSKKGRKGKSGGRKGHRKDKGDLAGAKDSNEELPVQGKVPPQGKGDEKGNGTAGRGIVVVDGGKDRGGDGSGGEGSIESAEDGGKGKGKGGKDGKEQGSGGNSASREPIAEGSVESNNGTRKGGGGNSSKEDGKDGKSDEEEKEEEARRRKQKVKGKVGKDKQPEVDGHGKESNSTESVDERIPKTSRSNRTKVDERVGGGGSGSAEGNGTVGGHGRKNSTEEEGGGGGNVERSGSDEEKTSGEEGVSRRRSTSTSSTHTSPHTTSTTSSTASPSTSSSSTTETSTTTTTTRSPHTTSPHTTTQHTTTTTTPRGGGGGGGGGGPGPAPPQPQPPPPQPQPSAAVGPSSAFVQQSEPAPAPAAPAPPAPAPAQPPPSPPAPSPVAAADVPQPAAAAPAPQLMDMGAALRSCFSADTLVQTAHGHRRMDQLEVGELVLVPASGDTLKFERIEMFYHRVPEAYTSFLHFETETGKSLSLTPLHLLPFGNCSDMHSTNLDLDGLEQWLSKSRFAHKATVGQCLLAVQSDGHVGVERIHKIGRRYSKGIYSPMTVEGSLLANGILTSCFSQIESHTVQKLSFDILVSIYRTFGYLTDFAERTFVHRQEIPSLLDFFHTLSRYIVPFVKY